MEAKTDDFYVSFNIPIPEGINIAQIKQNEIQTAFSSFFQQNPQILIQIFGKLKGTLNKNISVLPTTTTEQRKQMSLALKELGNEDLEWTDNIISSRKSKDYSSYNFFGDE
jgi:hypothetical protein